LYVSNSGGDQILRLTGPESTSVSTEDESTQDGFALHQNYPNPFNPSTQFTFDLPAASVVRLTVYNTLGQRLEVVVKSMSTAGSHSIQWQADRLPGGVCTFID